MLARVAALAAGGCALAHGFLLTSAPEGWTTVAQAGLAMACVACAVHLWRRPRPAAWTMHALLALSMVLGHPVSMAVSEHGNHHGPVPVVWAATAMPLLAGLGLVLAAVRWWHGGDVEVRAVPAQTSAASDVADSRRRVPQA